MKLVHPDLQFQINFFSDKIPVCIVESPFRWRMMQKELLAQYQGEEGDWVLSHNDKELKISKTVEIILNPLQLDENQRKLMNAFLKSFSENATGVSYWKLGQELNIAVQKFFCEIENEYSFGYQIAPEIDFTALAKAMHIQIETQYESDLERLLQYCILTEELLHTQLFIFWNLRNYFSNEEVAMFYEESIRRNWKILLMENFVSERIEGEKWYIIDKDNCEIY